MGKLESIYPIAIENTKEKIIQDMDFYLENQETMPSYSAYISDRTSFIEQIWINVWLNKASNDVPRKEKKAFLSERGFVTEGSDHKLINSMFRNELKKYRPFDGLTWIKKTFADNQEDWEKRYKNAREKFFRRQEEQRLAKQRWKIRVRLQEEANTFFEKNSLLLYLHVRYYIVGILTKDLKNKPKFQYADPYLLEEQLVEEGGFQAAEYLMVTDFFEELTGDIHSLIGWGRNRYEYENYFYRYERLVSDFIRKLAPDKYLNHLPAALHHDFLESYGERLTGEALQGILSDELADLSQSCFDELQEEYLSDLVNLEGIPFNETLHEEIFEKDVENRERRKAEVLAEQAKKRAEEQRMIDDIIGKAYTPSLGKKVRYVLHIGETNTGKTHKALEKMKEAESGLYLAPLRLLALEVFDKLNADGVPCSLKTGEEEKAVEGAKHVSSTVEMFHEKDYHEVIVIDEAQMIADKDRGFSWFRAITQANAKEVHIIGSKNIKMMLLNLLNEADLELHEYRREIPLEVEQREFGLKYTKKGDALICFSRRQVLETASRLKESGHNVSMIYGSMPPENRKRQIELFNRGETSVVVATDAIGMGLNLPIRRIVFLENEKFDGTRRRRLTSQEVKQIAGRAGRKGIYDTGKVAFTADIKIMNKLLEQVDEPVQTFTIAPTSAVFERFQKYYRNLGTFFEMWEKFEPPKGTKKASLSEERELYELIRDTEIEARFSLMDLYGFLHIPFSAKEPSLIRQWLETVEAIAESSDLPEPIIKTRNLEELELSYKAIGLHLLFLYRIGKRTEAVYWERIREEISDGVHDQLKDEMLNYQKKCKRCGKRLPDDSRFHICDACYQRA
ncbi:helicase-related protein [Peribacillus simplex]|uniref:RNA helicase n=1 Tax=Peribacillus simplex NBRC 15720 = DSM 1321 TaxID=1349754 RepID=A0A223EPE6_9BACI|nr:helicase-related protein [Peribacillus simplex]ASS97093.1 RNA helicase [Peribacillus simplex NBRC 15720 = DSM 1321]MEC1398560.1 helicase-related protein [Peribacillus simplex]